MNIPRFGLGTYRLKEQAVIDSVKTALEVGYRVMLIGCERAKPGSRAFLGGGSSSTSIEGKRGGD